MNIEMKRKLVLLTLLFFSFSLLCAQPAPGPGFHKKGYRNFHGRRMMEESSEMHLLFVKAKELPDIYCFKFVFSQPVNPESMNTDSFLVNGNEIHFEKMRLSKNYREIDFIVHSENADWFEENMELTVKEIESITGNKMEPVVIENFELDEDYKLIKKDER